MDYLYYYPSYTASVAHNSCRLAHTLHSVNHIEGNESSTISDIHVYLKIELLGSQTDFKTCVSFGDKITISDDEWFKYFADLKEIEVIRNFLAHPDDVNAQQLVNNKRVRAVAPSSSATTTTTTTASATPTSSLPTVTEYSLDAQLIIHDAEQAALIGRSDWWNIERIIACVSACIKNLNKIKESYVNRFNFFKKHLRMKRPTTVAKAYFLIDCLCDENSIVDCELKCLAIDILFHTSLFN